VISGQWLERRGRRGGPGVAREAGVAPSSSFASLFLAHERRSMEQVYFPRIKECLQRLPENDIWWRPNRASNSAGNLALHLAGNIRQWIGAGLGGEPDIRNRDREFQETGPIPRRALLALLEKEVGAACKLLTRLSTPDLERAYVVQGFRVTGFQAVTHVVEHFAYHCGQIIYLTKLRLGTDLNFTRLPGQPGRSAKAPKFPAV
jgi:uncharacterized damage-inducible protein DinB